VGPGFAVTGVIAVVFDKRARELHPRTYVELSEDVADVRVHRVAFFVIESGDATVALGGKDIARLSAGDYFGEVALIDDGARTATVTATTDLVCHGLTYWEFRPLVQHNATIGWNLLQTLARRLRNAQEEPPAAV
jgi:CRP-like cAMP-binding protein